MKLDTDNEWKTYKFTHGTLGIENNEFNGIAIKYSKSTKQTYEINIGSIELLGVRNPPDAGVCVDLNNVVVPPIIPPIVEETVRTDIQTSNINSDSSSTKNETDIPTDIPTDVPTDVPTDIPSDLPSDIPSYIPSDILSDIPSDIPANISKGSPGRTNQNICATSNPNSNPIPWIPEC